MFRIQINYILYTKYVFVYQKALILLLAFNTFFSVTHTSANSEGYLIVKNPF